LDCVQVVLVSRDLCDSSSTFGHLERMRGLGDTLIGERSYSCGEYVKNIPVVGGEEKRTWGTGRTVKGEGLNIDIDFFCGFSIGREQSVNILPSS